MGSHPLNLGVRFLLEVCALLAMGHWGWKQSDGPLRWLWMLAIPIVAMGIWVTFAVPNDPSRSGNAPIVIAGALRLLYEGLFFTLGTWALWRTGWPQLSYGFGALVVLHYALSYDRVIWLLRQ